MLIVVKKKKKKRLNFCKIIIYSVKIIASLVVVFMIYLVYFESFLFYVEVAALATHTRLSNSTALAHAV